MFGISIKVIVLTLSSTFVSIFLNLGTESEHFLTTSVTAAIFGHIKTIWKFLWIGMNGNEHVPFQLRCLLNSIINLSCSIPYLNHLSELLVLNVIFFISFVFLCNRLYAVGGYDGASRQCLNVVECYDPESDSWSHVAEMSTRRSGAGVGVLDGFLYAVSYKQTPASDDVAYRNYKNCKY